MQIGNRRVPYDSAAIGIGTALLASLFIGLADYYVISNAVRRDVASRCAITFRPESAPALITGVIFMTLWRPDSGASVKLKDLCRDLPDVRLRRVRRYRILACGGRCGLVPCRFARRYLAYGALAISVLITAQFVHAYELRARW